MEAVQGALSSYKSGGHVLACHLSIHALVAPMYIRSSKGFLNLLILDMDMDNETQSN